MPVDGGQLIRRLAVLLIYQCMSLSTGTSVSQFVSHLSQHIDMLSMALGESLKGVSDTQPAWLHMQC